MVLKKAISLQIKNLLKEYPHGLRITDIVKKVDINRNTAGRYLESLLVSGQVEMRRFGMAKIYTLSKRVPLSALLSISSELVLQLDSSLRIIYANEPFLLLVGTDIKSLFGKNIEYTSVALIFEDFFTEFIKNLKEGVSGKEWIGEIAFRPKDIILFCRIAPTVFDDGRKGVTVIFDDITQRKRDAQKIEESERQFRLMAENSVDMISRIKPDGTRLYVSPAYRTTLGYEPEELIGTRKDEFIHPDDAQIMGTLTGTLTPQNPITTVVFRTKHKDGHYIWIESIVRAIFDEKSGELSEFYAVTRDITERKIAEDTLQESEERYRSLIETTGTGYVILDKDGRVITANLEYLRLTGRSTLGEIINKPVTDWTAPYDIERNAREVEQCVRNGQVRSLEIDYQKPDCTIQPVEINASVIRSDSDLIILGLCRDITERKRAEEDLKISEQRYHQLVDISPDAVIIHQEGKIIFINPSGLTLLGTSDPDKIIGKNVLDFIQPEFRESVRKNIEKDLRGDITAPIELYMLRVDGTTIIVEGRGISTSINGKPAIQVAIRDITDRKHAEMVLCESEGKLTALLESITDIMSMMDKDLTIIWANAPARQYFGKDIIGRKCYEIYHLREEPCEPYPCPVLRAFQDGKIHHHEVTLIDNHGGKRVFEGTANVAVRDMSGSPVAVLEVAREITEKKKAEEALRESEAISRALINAPTDSVILADSKGIILALNEIAALRFGKRSEELVGILLDDLLPEELARLRRSLISRVLTTKEMVRFEDERDGRWFDTVAYPIVSDTGEVTKVAIIARDITNRKNTAIKLRESDLRIRLILDSTEDLIIMQDPEGRYLYFNAAARYGVPMEKTLGLTPYDFIDRASADRIVERVKTVAKTGQSMQEETPIIWNGQKLWFSDSLSPIRDANGTVIAVITISQNITERKHAEIALLESEATARALMNAPTDSVLLIDDQGMILALNEIAASRFGKRSNELVGMVVDDLLPKEIAQLRRSRMAPVLEKKEMVRFTDERAGRWYDTVSYPILNETGEVKKIAIIARDITEQKNFEKRLRESEQMYKGLLEQTFDAIAIHKEGKIAFLNERAAKILGAARPEDLMGKSIFEFIHPDSHKDLEHRIQKLRSDQGTPVPAITEKFIRTDGSTVTVEVIAISFNDNGTPAFRVAFREITSL